MSNFKLTLSFDDWWVLLLIIPLTVLALIPYFRLPKNRRRTRNRVVSMVIHILILALALCTLSGLTFHTQEEVTSFDVIFLVDASTSNEEAKEEMDTYIRRVLEEENADDFNVGIVTFAKNQLYVSEIDDHPDRVYESYISTDDTPDASATDIASALLYAKELLGELKNSRLIILSDGLATDGNATAAASAVAEAGVRVDAVHFDHDTPENEVQVIGLEVPENATVNGESIITVTLQSTGAGAVKLRLSDNTKRDKEQVINLSGGVESFELPHTFTTDGVHKLSVTLTSDSDSFKQNNQYFAYANLEGVHKVLIIDGTGSEATLVKDILNDSQDVTVTSPDKAPKTMSGLEKYAEIILMNVNMNDLPTSYDALLERYVKENGGGLFAVGGTNTFALGGMEDTVFADMLPVKMDSDEEQVLELMIIMDISSSMDKTLAGSGIKRIKVAKDGAIESVNALKDADYVGMVTFDANASVLMPIRPASSRAQVIDRINNIKTGVGTLYGNALSTAQSLLFASRNNADHQHVIFLTDGTPADTGYENTIRSMASRGITVSTIAIFDESDPDLGDLNALKSRVQQMAAIGGGRCYLVTNGRELPEIMRKETELSQKKLINEEKVTPQVKDYSPVIQGVDKLPAIDGYLGVTAKEGATVAYTAGDDPLYVEWEYGAGKVACFMSDLSGAWTRTFMRQDSTKIFLNNIVRNLAKTKEGMQVDFVNQNHTTVINVTTPAVVGNSVRVTVTNPDGKHQFFDLAVSGANSYTGSFPTPDTGIYELVIVERDALGDRVSSLETGYAFSYSKEYDAFADPMDGYKTLDAVCKSGGGQILLSTEQMFSGESLTVSYDTDPSIPMIIAMILLFLLDVAVRKFNFKWPHEIIRERREGK